MRQLRCLNAPTISGFDAYIREIRNGSQFDFIDSFLREPKVCFVEKDDGQIINLQSDFLDKLTQADLERLKSALPDEDQELSLNDLKLFNKKADAESGRRACSEAVMKHLVACWIDFAWYGSDKVKLRQSDEASSQALRADSKAKADELVKYWCQSFGTALTQSVVFNNRKVGWGSLEAIALQESQDFMLNFGFANEGSQGEGCNYVVTKKGYEIRGDGEVYTPARSRELGFRIPLGKISIALDAPAEQGEAEAVNPCEISDSSTEEKHGYHLASYKVASPELQKLLEADAENPRDVQALLKLAPFTATDVVTENQAYFNVLLMLKYSQMNNLSPYLQRADFVNQDMKKWDLTGADLTGADLTGADLTGATLTGAHITQDTCVNDCDFTKAVCDNFYYDVYSQSGELVASVKVDPAKMLNDLLEKYRQFEEGRKFLENGIFVDYFENSSVDGYQAGRYLHLLLFIKSFIDRNPKNAALKKAFSQALYNSHKRSLDLEKQSDLESLEKLGEHFGVCDVTLPLYMEEAKTTRVPHESAAASPANSVNRRELKDSDDESDHEGSEAQIKTDANASRPLKTAAQKADEAKIVLKANKFIAQNVYGSKENPVSMFLGDYARDGFVIAQQSVGKSNQYATQMTEDAVAAFKVQVKRELQEKLSIDEKSAEQIINSYSQKGTADLCIELLGSPSNKFVNNALGVLGCAGYSSAGPSSAMLKSELQNGKKRELYKDTDGKVYLKLPFTMSYAGLLGGATNPLGYQLPVANVDLTFCLEERGEGEQKHTGFYLKEFDCDNANFARMMSGQIDKDTCRALMFADIKKAVLASTEDALKSNQQKFDFLRKVAENLETALDLSNVDLSNVDLSGCKLDNKTRFPAKKDEVLGVGVSAVASGSMDSGEPFTFDFKDASGKVVAPLKITPKDFWKYYESAIFKAGVYKDVERSEVSFLSEQGALDNKEVYQQAKRNGWSGISVGERVCKAIRYVGRAKFSASNDGIPKSALSNDRRIYKMKTRTDAVISIANQAYYDAYKAQVANTLKNHAVIAGEKRQLVCSLLNLAEKLKVKKDLSGLDLSHADLNDLDFKGTDLRGANLTSANIDGTMFNEQTLFDKNTVTKNASAQYIRLKFGELDEVYVNTKHLLPYNFKAQQSQGDNTTTVFVSERDGQPEESRSSGGLALERLARAFYGDKQAIVRTLNAIFKGHQQDPTKHQQDPTKHQQDSTELVGDVNSGGHQSGHRQEATILAPLPPQQTNREASENDNSTLAKLDARNLKILVDEAKKLGTNVDLSGFDLSGLGLKELDLSGADLRGANLSNTDLRGLDLKKLDLSGADLRGANLSNTDLRGTNLSGAKLGGAILDNIHIDIETNFANVDAKNDQGVSAFKDDLKIKFSRPGSESNAAHVEEKSIGELYAALKNQASADSEKATFSFRFFGKSGKCYVNQLEDSSKNSTAGKLFMAMAHARKENKSRTYKQFCNLDLSSQEAQEAKEARKK